jgi:hypothetical protein
LVEQVAKTSARITPQLLIRAASNIKKETLGGVAPPINLTTGKPTPDSRCWYVAVAKNAGPWQVPNGLGLTCRR